MTALFSGTGLKLALAAIAVALLGGLFWSWQSERDARVESERRLEAVQTDLSNRGKADEVEREVDRLPESAADGELRREWSRD
jgi:uncharacterized protein HemX